MKNGSGSGVTASWTRKRKGNEMAVNSYVELVTHKGHEIEIATYADENVSIECLSCGEVLVDFEKEGKI